MVWFLSRGPSRTRSAPGVARGRRGAEGASAAANRAMPASIRSPLREQHRGAPAPCGLRGSTASTGRPPPV